MAVWKYYIVSDLYDGRNCIVTSYLDEIFYNSTVRAARKSVAWSLFFIFLLYSSAPMLATLSKLALMDPNLPTGIIGKSIAEVQAIDWVQRWSEVKQVFHRRL